MAAHLDIYLQRNEDWSRTVYVTADGDPIDLSSMTAVMQVRDKLTQALIATATIEMVDPARGEMTVTLKASEGSPLSAYGAALQIVNLPYDLRVTESDGFQTILFVGQVVLSRGETTSG